MEGQGKEIRILLIHQRTGSDVDDAVDREVRLLRDAGFQVDFVMREASGSTGLLGLLRRGKELAYSTRAQEEVVAKISTFRPKLVHVHNTFPDITPSVFAACASAKTPVVHTLHDFQIFCAAGTLLREGKRCEQCLGGNSLPAIAHACYRGSRPATLALSRAIRKQRRSGVWSREVSAFIATSKFAARKLIAGGLDSAKLHVKLPFAFPPPGDAPQMPEDYALFVGP